LLEANFRLKLPKKTLKSYWQFANLYVAILRNKKAMKQELNKETEKVAKQLLAEKLIGDGDTILGVWRKTRVIGQHPISWNGCYGWSAHYEGGGNKYAEPEYPYNLH
jgi:hypothetical protein